MALSAAEGVPLGDGEGAGGVADGEAVPVTVGVAERVGVFVAVAALSPNMAKLSSRRVPVAPSVLVPVPDEEPSRRMEQLATLLHSEGSGPSVPIVEEDVQSAVLGVITAMRPLATNVPSEPAVEYSKLMMLGPVAEWYMSNVKTIPPNPAVGTVKITPLGVWVYVVVE